MGINGLWNALSAEMSMIELTKLVMQEGFERNDGRKYRLGIDANIWFYLCAPSTITRGSSAELSIFYHKLTRLAKLPVDVIFVFDGNQKPEIKRGSKIIDRQHSLYKPMISFIEAFGFCHHTAPAEAEAELAYMSTAGLIDAVVTDDSDVLLFGGETIIRNWNIKKDREFIHVHRPQAETMSRESLILFGLLIGGDYDNKGLQGCGEEVAMALAREDFGKRLCSAASTCSIIEFDTYLIEWRRDVCHFLRENPTRSMSSRHPNLAATLSESFPDPHIIQLYLNPVVSSIDILEELALGSCPPDIRAITRLCELHFPWGTREEITEKLTASVLPSCLMLVLVEDAISQDSLSAQDSGGPGQSMLPSAFYITRGIFPDTVFTIGKMRILHGVSQHEVSGSASHAHQLILSSLLGLRTISNSNRKPNEHSSNKSEIAPTDKLIFCIPTAIIYASLGFTRITSIKSCSPDSKPVLFSSSVLDVSIAGVQTAFLSSFIDVPGLSWLAQAYFKSQKYSTESILDIVEAIFTSVAECSQGLTVTAVAKLLRRYVLMCCEFPPSIPRAYTLDPLKCVLTKVLSDGEALSGSTSSGYVQLSPILLLVAEDSNSSPPPVARRDSSTLNENGRTLSTAETDHDTLSHPDRFNAFDAFCVSEGLGSGALYQLDQ